jgi:hypothetical protein
VHYAPRFRKPRSVENFVTFNENVSLDCVTDENPESDLIQWFFTSKYDNFTKRVGINEKYTLPIENVNEEHEGFYECFVSNQIGNVNRKFNVSVIPKGTVFNQIN